MRLDVAGADDAGAGAGAGAGVGGGEGAGVGAGVGCTRGVIGTPCGNMATAKAMMRRSWGWTEGRVATRCVWRAELATEYATQIMNTTSKHEHNMKA